MLLKRRRFSLSISIRIIDESLRSDGEDEFFNLFLTKPHARLRWRRRWVRLTLSVVCATISVTQPPCFCTLSETVGSPIPCCNCIVSSVEVAWQCFVQMNGCLLTFVCVPRGLTTRSVLWRQVTSTVRRCADQLVRGRVCANRRLLL